MLKLLTVLDKQENYGLHMYTLVTSVIYLNKATQHN